MKTLLATFALIIGSFLSTNTWANIPLAPASAPDPITINKKDGTVVQLQFVFHPDSPKNTSWSLQTASQPDASWTIAGTRESLLYNGYETKHYDYSTSYTDTAGQCVEVYAINEQQRIYEVKTCGGGVVLLRGAAEEEVRAYVNNNYYQPAY